MTYNVNHHTLTLLAAADLSAKQFRAVKVDSNGAAAVCGAGEMAAGILQNNPTSGQACTVAWGGVSAAVAGGNVAKGAALASDANGKLVTATKASTNTGDTGGATDALVGSNVIGIALSSGADGETISVLLRSMGAIPTTAA